MKIFVFIILEIFNVIDVFLAKKITSCYIFSPPPPSHVLVILNQMEKTKSYHYLLACNFILLSSENGEIDFFSDN